MIVLPKFDFCKAGVVLHRQMADSGRILLGNVYNWGELDAYRKAAEKAGLSLDILDPGSEFPSGGIIPDGSRGLVLTGGDTKQMATFWTTKASLYPSVIKIEGIDNGMTNNKNRGPENSNTTVLLRERQK